MLDGGFAVVAEFDFGRARAHGCVYSAIFEKTSILA